MSHARQAYKDQVAQKRTEKARHYERDLRAMKHAAVPMTAVVRSPEWTYFLELLQGEIERLDAEAMALTQAYAVEPSFDPIRMAEAKALIMRVTVQRDTLQTVLALPKEIFEQGEKAELALATYDTE